ncbi:MAG: carboxypeptidase-like regulatory domain-containing protein [Bacteroidota bacterium]
MYSSKYYLLFFITTLFFDTTTPPWSGQVMDEAGKPLVYAEIYDQTGELLTWTDLDGNFKLAEAPANNRLQVRYPGFVALDTLLQKGQQLTLSLQKPIPVTPPPTRGGIPTSRRKVHSESKIIKTKHPAIRETSTGEYIYRGKILDDGEEPLIGASILVQDTETGTVTDIDGRYQLYFADSCATLVISYTGYETLDHAACASEELMIIMTSGAMLEEVVVTGLSVRAEAMTMAATTPGKTKRSRSGLFGSRKKTTAPPPPAPPPPAAAEEVLTFSADDFAEAPAADIDYAMEGELPTAGQLTAGEINDFSK